MKICSKCKFEKDLTEFNKCKNTKDGCQYICKQCEHEYYKKNTEKIKEKERKYYKKNIFKKVEYYKKNQLKIQKRQQIYHKKNKKILSKKKKAYNNSKAKYDTFAPQILYADKVRNIDNFLQVKCTYCGKWYFPTTISIKSRIQALNEQIGKGGSESRLYCSTECKKACPIYWKQLYQDGHPKANENSQSREVQPELRQMVFERDNYACSKCKKHQNDLNVPLHCHHTEGIRWNPIESADIDQCMTVCKDCHKEVHKQKDCGYRDLQCKKP